jgi:hypothetical protein
LPFPEWLRWFPQGAIRSSTRCLLPRT